MTFQPCRPATIKLLPYKRAPFVNRSFFIFHFPFFLFSLFPIFPSSEKRPQFPGQIPFLPTDGTPPPFSPEKFHAEDSPSAPPSGAPRGLSPASHSNWNTGLDNMK